MAPFVPPKAGTGDILVLADNVSDDDGRVGEPLTGGIGAMVDTWLGNVKISRHSATMSALVSCAHPGNLFPTDADKKGSRLLPLADAHTAVQHCLRNHVEPLLASRPWSKIILIGDKALDHLTGKKSLFDWGGTPLPIPRLDPTRRVAIATMSPVKLMNDQSLLPLIYSDLKRTLAVPDEQYIIYPDPAVLAEFSRSAFALDIETDIPPTKIRMFSISNAANTGVVVRWTDDTVAQVSALLRGAKVVYGQNLIQFDLPHLRRHGAGYETNPNECSVRDTMLMHHLIWPTLPHDLGTLGRQYLDKPFWKKWTADTAANNAEEVYACRDSDGTYQLGLRLWAELERVPRLRRLYETVQVPMARICALMTEIGVQTDPEEARKLVTKADTVLSEKEALLPESMRPATIKKRKRVPAPEGTLTPPKYGKSGKLLKQKPVKWLYEEVEVIGTSPWRNSAKTANFLYGDLGLKTKLNAEGRVTTGKLALAQLFHATGDPQIEAIRELRRWAARKKICKKLADTEVAKKLHVSFNLHGTTTGRLSCSGDENKIQLQNQTEELRVMFVPSRPGWRIFSCDFSQMEARLAAWFARDTSRAARFDQPGYSEYKHAASVFLGVPMDQVKKEKSPESPYHRAKTIVLGTDRALGARKISITNDIPEAEVKKMQAAWKSQIPATIAWQRETGDRAKRDKQLWNPFGRRCLFYTSSAYCNDPETPVLKSDLTWQPIHSLAIGDKLIGFEEVAWGVLPRPPKIQEATVLNTRTFTAPRYRIVTEQGELICTPNHAWLIRNWLSTTNETRSIERWIRTDSLAVGDTIVYFTRPWKQLDTREAGWLAGILDGEAHYTKSKRGRVYVSQKRGRVHDGAVAAAQSFGFKTTPYRYNAKDVGVIAIDATGTGALWDGLEVIGSLGAQRLIQNARYNWEGANLWANAGGNKKAASVKVLAIEKLADGDVTGITTSTGTFIANGFCSHNTEGISFLPQSTGADVIFRAMIALMYERIEWPLEWVKPLVPVIVPLPEPARLLIQIHDELVGECPESQVAEVEAVLKAVLEQPWPELNGLALPANFSHGANWLEAGEG